MRGKQPSAWLAVIVCAMGLAACGSSQNQGGGGGSSKSPVTLSLVSFNVPGSALLPEFESAANAAAKVINGEGGFGGRKLVINPCNSMLQPAAATVCAHKTLTAHPVAMLGCDLTWSGSGLPVYTAAGVPSINCLNNQIDVTNKRSFGLTASAVGENRGLMRWVCTQPSMKSVVSLLPNLPQYPGQIYPESVQTPLHSCGKTSNVVYYPLTAVDVAPYVVKALGFKPDFILYSGIGAQVDSFFRAFKQNGWPASKVAVPDTDFIPSITGPAGNLINGAVVEGQFTTANNTARDPGVATFEKALNGNTTLTNDPNVAWAYAEVMFVYNAAKAIGFDKFNASTFQHWLSTVSSFPVPLSHAYTNPGPAGASQIKQPYTRIERWENGKFTPLSAGPKKNGWIKGW
jgi:ABC-type branched-subunit amino acid transport system substrate-binding protein